MVMPGLWGLKHEEDNLVRGEHYDKIQLVMAGMGYDRVACILKPILASLA